MGFIASGCSAVFCDIQVGDCSFVIANDGDCLEEWKSHPESGILPLGAIMLKSLRSVTWVIILQLALASQAVAIAPPPVPRWFKDARDRIASVKRVVGGSWESLDPAKRNLQLLRVGTFGDLAPNFLMFERTYLQFGREFHRLSVLFYSTDCKGYTMLSVDKLSDPNPPSTANCSRSFPIGFHPDGSLSFEYTDWNSDRVLVSVNRDVWREVRFTPGIAGNHEIELKRSTRPITWGDLK